YEEYAKEARARIVLATEIYQARTKKGLSQEALAKNTDTTQKVISKVENGEVNVGIDLIFRLAKALDIKLQLGKTAIL
ncbi:MAG: helix-turn-helix transcriptional regulator, partial [Patescibacteria group bacterium]